MLSTSLSIKVGARNSPLSRAQVEEVFREISQFHPVIFEPIFIQTIGDQDKTTSLRDLGKTDFFTKEIDEMVLNGKVRIAIHSAKDLPDPLCGDLQVVALTKGVDPSDVVVFREELQSGGVLGVSSYRREERVKKWRPDLRCIDIRGTIHERLALVDEGKIDGVVMANAALIRLGISRKTIPLEGETVSMQGRLAIVARKQDQEMEEVFRCIHYVSHSSHPQ